MRSYFYDKEEIEEANFLLYRIKSRKDLEFKSNLNIVLVSNWRLNECYVRIESGSLDVQKRNLQVVAEGDTISLEGQNSYAHYVFAAKLFGALEQNKEPDMISGNK